jgi:FKBP-type peptidyl-prolyl cis-trans isomerase SlyD
MLIGPNCVVSMHYELTNSAGEVLDTSAGHEPLTYLHGAQNIIPGLENQLVGRSTGDNLEVVVQPQDGYGEHQAALVQQVPRNAFPDSDALETGMRFTADSANGDISVVITALSDDTVTVDGNHPLAGQVLHFSVAITDVRAATEEEIAHGHVHTPGHHHH